jgi:hypothetical protein
MFHKFNKNLDKENNQRILEIYKISQNLILVIYSIATTYV